MTDIRTIGSAVAAHTYKLVDEAGNEIQLPALLTAWDGSRHWVESFKPSRFQSNEGYIYTRLNETFVPSVFRLKIISTT